MLEPDEEPSERGGRPGSSKLTGRPDSEAEAADPVVRRQQKWKRDSQKECQKQEIFERLCQQQEQQGPGGAAASSALDDPTAPLRRHFQQLPSEKVPSRPDLAVVALTEQCANVLDAEEWQLARSTKVSAEQEAVHVHEWQERTQQLLHASPGQS